MLRLTSRSHQSSPMPLTSHLRNESAAYLRSLWLLGTGPGMDPECPVSLGPKMGNYSDAISQCALLSLSWGCKPRADPTLSGAPLQPVLEAVGRHLILSGFSTAQSCWSQHLAGPGMGRGRGRGRQAMTPAAESAPRNQRLLQPGTWS